MLGEILLGVVAVAAAFAGAITYAIRRIPRPIQIGIAGNRRALLYQLRDGPRPTLILLHPYSGDALSTARYSGFLQAAMPRGFNVAVPDAIGHEWHDSPDEPSHGGEIGFLTALVEKLVAEKIADAKRIFIAGISNGGMMAFAMACARPDLFAGIGTISAGMPKHVFESCPLTEPMPLVMINGDADNVLPYVGGHVGDPSGFFRTTAGVEETGALFAKADNENAACQPRRTELRDRQRVLERIDWSNGQTTIVTLVKVRGGGHDVIGWRAPWQAFLGLPPRGPATALSIVERFAELSSHLR